MIKPDFIERIKDLPIVEVIRKFIELKTSGVNYSAKSPWTNEKTASFYVNPVKGIFKDFSSGRGGNAITFVMEHENVGFVDAIIKIADKFGERVEYEISEKATQDQSEREELLDLNALAGKIYQTELVKLHKLSDPLAHPAIAELNTRGYTDETITAWQIGYAPNSGTGIGYDNWKFLTSQLHEMGRIEPALKVGLLKKKELVVYDRFRNRIMFPIHNHLGRIVGFSGRWLGVKDAYNPKYINTEETVIYSKGKVLFGLHIAGPHIRKARFAYLVEGNTDVISFHQAGLNVTIGSSGTALTDDQCLLLKSYCSKVVMFPDFDPNDKGEVPGEEAAMRNIDVLMKHGFEVGIVPMPRDGNKKMDPDELARAFAKMQVTTVSLGDKIDAPAPAEMLADGEKKKMMELDKSDPEVQRLVSDTGKVKKSTRKSKKKP